MVVKIAAAIVQVYSDLNTSRAPARGWDPSDPEYLGATPWADSVAVLLRGLRHVVAAH